MVCPARRSGDGVHVERIVAERLLVAHGSMSAGRDRDGRRRDDSALPTLAHAGPALAAQAVVAGAAPPLAMPDDAVQSDFDRHVAGLRRRAPLVLREKGWG